MQPGPAPLSPRGLSSCLLLPLTSNRYSEGEALRGTGSQGFKDANSPYTGGPGFSLATLAHLASILQEGRYLAGDFLPSSPFLLPFLSLSLFSFSFLSPPLLLHSLGILSH